MLDKIYTIVAENIGCSLDTITPKTNLYNESDSLGRLNITFELEEEFGIDIEDAEADKVITVADIQKLVESKLSLEITGR